VSSGAAVRAEKAAAVCGERGGGSEVQTGRQTTERQNGRG
jgi:hypothetical protein